MYAYICINQKINILILWQSNDGKKTRKKLKLASFMAISNVANQKINILILRQSNDGKKTKKNPKFASFIANSLIAINYCEYQLLIATMNEKYLAG